MKVNGRGPMSEPSIENDGQESPKRIVIDDRRKSYVDDGLPSSTPPRRHSVESSDSMAVLSVPPTIRQSRSRSIDNADISRQLIRLANCSSSDDSMNSDILPIPASTSDEQLISSIDDLDLVILEGDPNGVNTAIFVELNNPNIEDNTPAAAALRANRDVKVPKMVKVARSLHAQTVRRFIKRATLRAKSGNRRGKPPRIPPNHQKSNTTNTANNEIYVVEEEDEGAVESDLDSSIESMEEGTHFGAVSYSKTSGDIVESDVMIGNMEELEPKKNRTIAENLRQVPVEVMTATMETGKKILATADPHDIIQNQRWRRRKKRKKNPDRKSYVKGKVIDGQHELYALSIAVMLGVRTSIGNTNSQMTVEGRRWLTSDDFMATEKYEFKPSGGSRTPPHQLGHTFKFKDYSPIAFAYLRRMFGVNEFDFLLSVCGNTNFIEFISNAKSGQFFFYSSDGKYMVKTMTNAESKFLRRILPHYFRHCSQNPNTLMTKFLGMYRVKMYHLRRNVKFVIMNSVYYTDKFLQAFYDLKGSVTGRDAKSGHDVKKDNDLRRSLPDSALALLPDVRLRMREQIKSDCEFMMRMKIMDYSMLVGIHHIPPKRGITNDRSIENTGFRFSMERKESSQLNIRNAMKRPSNTCPVSFNTSSIPSRSGASIEDTSHISNVTVQGINPTKQSLDDGSVIEQNSNREQQKISTKPNPILSTNMPEKDDSSTIGGNSKTSEDQSSIHWTSLYDFALDDDDDNSFLEGSNNHSAIRPTMGTVSTTKVAELEVKKEQTVKNIYWPFHRYYDLNGLRRLYPCRCTECGQTVPCPCDAGNMRGFKIPDFVLPVSDRKDGGLTMDTTGFKMPMKFKGPTGRDQHYEGKIFYMGIIDILQQYNIRKRIEARYRRVKGAGWKDASCVHPKLYAERFIGFFDEYSQSSPAPSHMHIEEGEEVIVFESRKSRHETKNVFETANDDSLGGGGDETAALIAYGHFKAD